MDNLTGNGGSSPELPPFFGRCLCGHGIELHSRRKPPGSPHWEYVWCRVCGCDYFHASDGSTWPSHQAARQLASSPEQQLASSPARQLASSPARQAQLRRLREGPALLHEVIWGVSGCSRPGCEEFAELWMDVSGPLCAGCADDWLQREEAVAIARAAGVPLTLRPWEDGP